MAFRLKRDKKPQAKSKTLYEKMIKSPYKRKTKPRRLTVYELKKLRPKVEEDIKTLRKQYDTSKSKTELFKKVLKNMEYYKDLME